MGDKEKKSQPTSSGTSSQTFSDAGSSTLQNKQGEPQFKLQLNMNKVEFKCSDDRRPVSVILKMHNPLSETITFKVRCTSADIFRVQPPLGFVKPKETATITIWYQNQDRKEAISKSHYFAFYHAKTDGRTARELWANAKADGVRRIPAVFSDKK